MKIIYEILYPFGAKKTEVEETYVTKFPYTEIEPDTNRDLMLQFFDVKMNVWRPVEFMAGSEKIALLDNFYTKAMKDVSDLIEQNEELSNKIDNQDTQLTDTQIALAEVYEMLVPTDAVKEAK